MHAESGIFVGVFLNKLFAKSSLSCYQAIEVFLKTVKCFVPSAAPEISVISQNRFIASYPLKIAYFFNVTVAVLFADCVHGTTVFAENILNLGIKVS